MCLYPSSAVSQHVVRRPQLEINKLFSTRAKSLGSHRYALTNAQLHDRNTIGGNSEIWGGFFNTAQLKNIERLTSTGIQLVPLSFGVTGSASNMASVVQLQESTGEILNVSSRLRAGRYQPLDSIKCESGKIRLKLQADDDSDMAEITLDGKVFVCTGVVQTIDVLMRSGFIKPGDELTLDEFSYELMIGEDDLCNVEQNACVISYTPGRAAAHLLGIQKTNSLSSARPFGIHQVFHPRSQTLRIIAGDGVLTGAPVMEGDQKKSHFGKSIHYCNLKINGERLADVAAKWHPNLFFVSMASVMQSQPGPISSDIYRYLESISNEL